MKSSKLKRMDDLVTTSISDMTVSVFADAKSRNSFCWNYFGSLVVCDNNKKRIVHPDQVFCYACLEEIKQENEDVSFGLVKIKIKSYNRTVSTGNLTRHLRDAHKIHEPVKKVKTVGDYTPTPKAPKASTSRATPKIDKRFLAPDVALWLCKSLIPFDCVADEGMVDFFMKHGIVREDCVMPSKELVSGPVLSDLYESMLYTVKESICRATPRTCAIALDPWTDHLRGLHYITFTLHYLTTEFDLKAITLSTHIINGANIETMIKTVKEEFGLEGKNIHAITDPGHNVHHVIAHSNMNYHPCLGHGLHQLVTIDGINSIPEIKTIVSKCKNIIKAVRYRLPDLEIDSEKSREFLIKVESVGEAIEADEVDPIRDNDFTATAATGCFKERTLLAIPTRWHVVLDMLESLVDNCKKDTINKILAKIGKDELRITKTDWNILEDLVKFLKKFRETVQIMAPLHTCTINLALVFRSEIIDILNSISDDESLVLNRLKCNMAANIDLRFTITNTIVAAALLDSRFIGLKEVDSYLESQNMTRATFLASFIKAVICPDDLTQTNTIDEYSFASTSHNDSLILNQLARKHCVNVSKEADDDPIDKECWRYVTSANPLEPKDGNLLFYWNTKKLSYPWLAAFAKYILCIPVTCIPSQRIFSNAGLEMSTKRSRLSPTRVNKILFVHNNYKECHYECFSIFPLTLQL